MKIAFLDVDTVGNVPNLDKLQTFGEITLYRITSAGETTDRIKDCEVIITNKVILDRKILQSAKQLKLICVAATGTNNVDLKFCKENGIEVKNAVNYSTHSVAQSTFNSLFYLIHQSSYYDQYVKNGQYANSKIFTHIYHDFWELTNKNFGIIGLGNIGKEVANIATSFGAKVFYYSTSGQNENPDHVRLDLEELLKLCDVISIHAPLNEKTKHLLGRHELEMMKTTAILINMGRGGIVDENALAKMIDENRIGGAALDVLSDEPIKKDNPLLKVKYTNKLFITPHNAWASLEARIKLIEIICDHLREYVSHQDSGIN